MRKWCFYDPVDERVPTVPSRNERVVVAPDSVTRGFVFAFLFCGGWGVCPAGGDLRLFHGLACFNPPLELGVLFSKCFHFVCIPFPVLCEFLLHPSLNL